MYVLKDRKCERCGNEILVLHYKDKSWITGKTGLYVDHGECVFCGKIEILPGEEYKSFVERYCVSRRYY